MSFEDLKTHRVSIYAMWGRCTFGVRSTFDGHQYPDHHRSGVPSRHGSAHPDRRRRAECRHSVQAVCTKTPDSRRERCRHAGGGETAPCGRRRHPDLPLRHIRLWGGAYEALIHLHGVRLVRPIPNAQDSTAYVYLEHEGLPDLEVWPTQFATIANGTHLFRGVEVTVEGQVQIQEGDTLVM